MPSPCHTSGRGLCFFLRTIHNNSWFIHELIHGNSCSKKVAHRHYPCSTNRPIQCLPTYFRQIECQKCYFSHLSTPCSDNLRVLMPQAYVFLSSQNAYAYTLTTPFLCYKHTYACTKRAHMCNACKS